VSHDRPSRAAYGAWIAVCLIWGTTYLAIRIALESIPPALIGGIRYTIAGLVLIGWLRARGQRLPERSTWPGLALVGTLLIAVGNGFVIWAEQWVPSGISAVVVASAPFWMSGLDAMAPGGERLAPRTLAGLCVGFAGIVLLVWPDLTAGAGGRQFLIAVIALELACVGWSAGSTYSKRYAAPQHAIGASAMQMLFGGVVMLAVATLAGEWTRLAFTPRSGAAELYLIVFGSLIGYSSYLFALEQLPVSTVSLYAYVNPVIAVVLGTLLLDEPFGWRVVGASAMVLVGIAIVRWRPSPRRKIVTSYS
jgi:drug/metabolite transporter (DMT)-like permease